MVPQLLIRVSSITSEYVKHELSTCVGSKMIWTEGSDVNANVNVTFLQNNTFQYELQYKCYKEIKEHVIQLG